MAERIYLDNAATSWPKPETVYRAVDDYLRNCGAAAGRSAYHSAQVAERIVAEARRRVAQFIGAESPERIVFTPNGTASLNLAIHGLLRSGDHVVTTCAEHNSVLRPLRFLEEQGTITVTRVPVNELGVASPGEMQNALRPDTRLVVMQSASNVTGADQHYGLMKKVVQNARFAGNKRLRFLVDGAQSLGYLGLHLKDDEEPIDGYNIDLLASPGHKSLLGPLGTGFLYIAPGVERELEPHIQGGTGTLSESDRQPESMPDRYEAGNVNVAGLAGLAAGIAWIEEQGVERLKAHKTELTQALVDGLGKIGGVRLYSVANTAGVVSFTCEGYAPQEVAAALDVAAGIQVRAGLHCAPLLHAGLGTLAGGGTIRMSVGPFTTPEQIERAVEAVRELMSG